jgi:hypothetical protein
MKKPAAYRLHAEECRKLAVGALSDDDRAQLLDMAETWANLAKAREDMLARYPELDTSRIDSGDQAANMPVDMGVKDTQARREA